MTPTPEHLRVAREWLMSRTWPSYPDANEHSLATLIATREAATIERCRVEHDENTTAIEGEGIMPWEVHNFGCYTPDCVREKVRRAIERCAKVADDYDGDGHDHDYYTQLGNSRRTQSDIAAAIRALGREP